MAKTPETVATARFRLSRQLKAGKDEKEEATLPAGEEALASPEESDMGKRRRLAEEEEEEDADAEKPGEPRPPPNSLKRANRRKRIFGKFSVAF